MTAADRPGIGVVEELVTQLLRRGERVRIRVLRGRMLPSVLDGGAGRLHVTAEAEMGSGRWRRSLRPLNYKLRARTSRRAGRALTRIPARVPYGAASARPGPPACRPCGSRPS